jgi:hypothetical protein
VKDDFFYSVLARVALFEALAISRLNLNVAKLCYLRAQCALLDHAICKCTSMCRETEGGRARTQFVAIPLICICLQKLVKETNNFLLYSVR